MRLFWLLTVGAFVCLGAAAIWMGGINQDEGWYLYAANLVAEGQVPYRDFFYTQGPIMPCLYSAFSWVWNTWGLLGARLFTFALGTFGLLVAVCLARRLVPEQNRNAASLIVSLLLGANLYHLYFLAIPKTYALAALFTLVGFLLLSVAFERLHWLAVVAGLSFALASGTRISLGALLPTIGVWLLVQKRFRLLLLFCLGGFSGLALTYGPFLCDANALGGLMRAQAYHAARGGFDLTWTVGSLSRLVRWYLPVFVVLGMGILEIVRSRQKLGFSAALVWGFAIVFAIQMAAPFPYEDYQVPIMGLLAVFAAVCFAGREAVPLAKPLLTMGLCFACSFGSPLLEKWATNGQDRFWSLKKTQYELAQLRSVANRIRQIDPQGRELLTQDLYLAIESARKVPRGLEMGPFSMLTDKEWRELLSRSTCPVAALSGYSFAIQPPVCNERPAKEQLEYWELLRQNYELVDREDMFGQNATPLLILKRK